MDCPVLSRLESAAAACGLGQAPQNHRWIERNGVEAVRGQANRGAIGRPRRDDGDSRGKRAEYFSKLCGVELGHSPPVHSWSASTDQSKLTGALHGLPAATSSNLVVNLAHIPLH